MAAAKENRRVKVLKPRPRKQVVREETPMPSAPKTKNNHCIPLKRKRSENEDQDDSPVSKHLKLQPSPDRTDSDSESDDEPPRPLLPPIHLKYFAAPTTKNSFPPGVKLPHDFHAPFTPHFDKRKLRSRCNITIDLTFKRPPTPAEISARWRMPPEEMIGWEVRKDWLQGEEWLGKENFEQEHGMCSACRAVIEPMDTRSGARFDYVHEWVRHRGMCAKVRAREEQRRVPIH